MAAGKTEKVSAKTKTAKKTETEEVANPASEYIRIRRIEMHRPSAPKLPPQAQAKPSPRPREVNLEAIRGAERGRARRRQGYSSTVLTRGGLGSLQTRKPKVTTLGGGYNKPGTQTGKGLGPLG